jgi:hypothetical protein
MSLLSDFSDKIKACLDESCGQIVRLSKLSSDPRVLARFADETPLSPEARAALHAQAESEALFLRSGGRDAIIVREATKSICAVLASVSGEGHLETASTISTRDSRAMLPAGAARLASVLRDASKLVGMRLETGADPLKATDERSLRIQSRIQRAELDVVIKRESLVTARATQIAQKAELDAALAKVSAEIRSVQAQRAENVGALEVFASSQSSTIAAGHSVKMQELAAELVKLQGEFDKLVETNEAAQVNLRKRRNHLRAEVSLTVAAFDRDCLELAEKAEVCYGRFVQQPACEHMPHAMRLRLSCCDPYTSVAPCIMNTSVVQKSRELIAKERAQLEVLQRYFAVVDMDTRLAAEEAEVEGRRKARALAAIAAKEVPAARKIQHWMREIWAVRAAEKKGKKKAGKGGGKKDAKGGDKKGKKK